MKRDFNTTNVVIICLTVLAALIISMTFLTDVVR